MSGLVTQTLDSSASILTGGLAWLDCRVVHTYPAGLNTLFVAEVVEAKFHSAEIRWCITIEDIIDSFDDHCLMFSLLLDTTRSNLDELL